MNSAFFIYFGAVVAMLVLAVLAWAMRQPRKRKSPGIDVLSLEDHGRPHASYLPQIARALAAADFDSLSSEGLWSVARQLRKERRRIALAYLPAVRQDFDRLLRLARAIAVLSPEVRTIQEWERLRITAQFYVRYQWVRLSMLFGVMPLPQLNGLSQMVSGLAVRMETALGELGERAAVGEELAALLDRRRLNIS